MQGLGAESVEVGRAPRRELESCEGAVGACGAGEERKGMQRTRDPRGEASPRGKWLRGCSGARSCWDAEGACVTRGEGRPRRLLRSSKRRWTP